MVVALFGEAFFRADAVSRKLVPPKLAAIGCIHRYVKMPGLNQLGQWRHGFRGQSGPCPQ